MTEHQAEILIEVLNDLGNSVNNLGNIALLIFGMWVAVTLWIERVKANSRS